MVHSLEVPQLALYPTIYHYLDRSRNGTHGLSWDDRTSFVVVLRGSSRLAAQNTIAKRCHYFAKEYAWDVGNKRAPALPQSQAIILGVASRG